MRSWRVITVMEAGSLPVSSGTRVAVTCTYSWGTGGGTLFVEVFSALIWLKPLRRAVRQSQARPAARHPARLMSSNRLAEAAQRTNGQPDRCQAQVERTRYPALRKKQA